MEMLNKRILYWLLYCVVIFGISHYGRIYVQGHNDLQQRMYYDFEDLGEELQLLNDKLAGVLILNNYDGDKEKTFIDQNIVHDFFVSSNDASKAGKSEYYYDYSFMYQNVNKAMHNILSDGSISSAERRYIEGLYAYTAELIKEYKDILKAVSYEYDFDNIRKVKKRIVKVYNSYCKKADTLLNTPQYSFLKEYEGAFSKTDFKEAKAYSEAIFSKLVKNKKLIYDDSRGKDTAEYVFRTSMKDGLPQSLNELKSDAVEYEVRYDKKTKQVNVDIVSQTIPPEVKTEAELDKIAASAAALFNKNVMIYYKNIKYDKDKKPDNITYEYIEKVSDIYDETKKMRIQVEASGRISSFQIMYPYDEPIIMPAVSKEEILSKLDKQAEVKDVLIIRNIDGKPQYAVHIKYEEALYEAVFDAINGKLIYYGHEIGKNY